MWGAQRRTLLVSHAAQCGVGCSTAPAVRCVLLYSPRSVMHVMLQPGQCDACDSMPQQCDACYCIARALWCTLLSCSSSVMHETLKPEQCKMRMTRQPRAVSCERLNSPSSVMRTTLRPDQHDACDNASRGFWCSVGDQKVLGGKGLCFFFFTFFFFFLPFFVFIEGGRGRNVGCES